MSELKWLSAFFHSFIITIILLLIELNFYIILSFLIKDFYIKNNYLIIMTLLNKFLYLLILQCISKHIKNKKTVLSFNRSTLFINILSMILGYIALLFASIYKHVPLSLHLNIMITVCITLILVINVFLIWFHTEIQENNKKFEELQILLQKKSDTLKYFGALHKQDEKQKILIHDIRKHLSAIAMLNKMKETEKIASYINDITQSSDLQSPIHVCDNNLLNSILFQIKQQCEKYGTILITDVRSGCLGFLHEYDLTALFSNLLDNAVNATINIPDSYIELSITPQNDNTVITIVNSCKNDPFSNNYTQLTSIIKDRHNHGYGIKSIECVVKKYDGIFHYYFNKKNLTFHTIIILNRK